MKMKDLRKQTKENIPQYATLLLCKPGRAKHLAVVLCHIEDEDLKFVTWTYNIEAKGCGHGHYFHALDDTPEGHSKALLEAIEDYAKRD